MSCSSCSMNPRSCGIPSAQGLYSNAVPWAPSALPYTTTPGSAFRKLCFQPSYATGCNEPSVNCTTTMSTRSGALFNEECASGLALNGQCAAFPSTMPRAVGSVSNAELERYVYATTGGQGFSTAQNRSAPACANPLVMLNDGTVVCPIGLPNETAPQCQQALQRVWQADRFKGVDNSKYAAAKQMESCFVYDTLFPNGQSQPVAVKATPSCLSIAPLAFAKVSDSCAVTPNSGFCQ